MNHLWDRKATKPTVQTRSHATESAPPSGRDDRVQELHGVMPAELTERGVPAPVKGLADRMPIGVVLNVAGFERRPSPTVESTAFFVTAEAMVNAVKHAHATELTVTLVRDAQQLRLDVRDDGIGGAGSGDGIRSMTDRVEALGGRLRIESALGAGTSVRAELPCVS